MNRLAVIEGLLFVMGEDGLTIDQLSDILEITKEETKEAISELMKEYEKDYHGLKLRFLGNTFKLTTKEEHKEYYQKLIENSDTNTLSEAALETLIIIAYNEPTTRLKVDEIRGVSSGYVIRKLLAKGLVKESGKSDLPGRPILYETTNEFLDYFGLSSIKDLPPVKDVETIDDEDVDLFLSKYKETDEK